jgi:hypothetical protein
MNKERLRLRGEIEEAGRDRIVRCVINQDDPFTMYGLLDTLHISSPESIDLIVAFITLRGRGFPLEDLQAWKKRAHAYLRRLVGDERAAGEEQRAN